MFHVEPQIGQLSTIYMYVSPIPTSPHPHPTPHPPPPPPTPHPPPPHPTPTPFYLLGPLCINITPITHHLWIYFIPFSCRGPLLLLQVMAILMTAWNTSSYLPPHPLPSPASHLFPFRRLISDLLVCPTCHLFFTPLDATYYNSHLWLFPSPPFPITIMVKHKRNCGRPSRYRTGEDPDTPQEDQPSTSAPTTESNAAKSRPLCHR